MKCINGVYDISNPRGNNGLYEHVFTDPITLIVINPCNDPTKSGIKLSLQINDMTVPIGKTSTE